MPEPIVSLDSTASSTHIVIASQGPVIKIVDKADSTNLLSIQVIDFHI